MKPYDYEANKTKLQDSLGRRITTGLFEELAHEDTATPPVFKLSDWRKTYVEVADPTEYNTAQALIGDWDHWQLLLSNPVFLRHVEEWRKEVEIKLRSQAVQHLIQQSRDLKGTAAAKWLAEGGFVSRDRRTVKGRKDESKVQDGVKQRVNDDAERLGLSVVQGGKAA